MNYPKKTESNYNRSRNNDRRNDDDRELKKDIENNAKKWITEPQGLDKDFIKNAKEIGDKLKEKKLTNSQIRNIYGEIKRIQMKNFDDEKSSFYLLSARVAYAFGRDDKNKGLEFFKFIFDTLSNQVNDGKDYERFCKVLEAILAYHKAAGGK